MENRGPGSTGLPPNVAAGVSYIAGWLSGIIVYFIEKQDRFVRFHAMQSIIFSVAVTVLWIALSIIGGILGRINDTLACLFGLPVTLLFLAFFVVWIYCMVKAFTGSTFKLPVIGDMAEKYV